MFERSILSAAFVAVLTLSPGHVRANCGHGCGHGGGPPRERLEQKLEDIGVEPARLEEIRALLDAADREREPRREQMRAAFEEMRALLDQDMPDEAALMRQAEELGALRTEAHKSALSTMLAVRAQLTPEQRTALREKMREERGKRRQSFWRRWFGRGPGAPPPAP